VKVLQHQADLQGLIATYPNGGLNQGLQININLGVFNKVEPDEDASPQRAIDVTPKAPPDKDPNPSLN
jgi:hypothetical protein